MSRLKQMEYLEARLDDLATGQLGWLAALRLRRQLARDPELSHAYAEIRQLRGDLNALSAIPTPIRTSVRQTGTFQIGRLTMQRRTAALAAGALMLISVSAAVAERYWGPREADCGCPGIDMNTDWWWFHGPFRGNITLLSSKGTLVNTLYAEGASPTGTLKLVFTRSHHELASAAFSGMGKHAVLDKQGNVQGYIVMSPLTTADETKIKQASQETDHDMVDYYQRPERITPSDDKRGFGYIMPLPDMVGEQTMELVQVNELSRFNTLPFSWKSYGDVHVVSKVRAEAAVIPMWGAFPSKLTNWWKHPAIQVDDSPLAGTTVSKPGETADHAADLRLPPRTLIDEAESAPAPMLDQLSQLPPDARAYYTGLHTQPHVTPETYWAIADPKADMDRKKGQWAHVLQSGKFEGYGHFAVRDSAGKVVMTLDVTRPQRKPGLTLDSGDVMIKKQKVVPGWDGEE